MPEYQEARRIGIYLSMPTSEISTGRVVQDALQRGKKVFVPYIFKLAPEVRDPSDRLEYRPPNSAMDMLELHSMDDYESLKPDKWGIPSLGKDTAAGRYNCFGKQGPSVRLLQQLLPGSRALDMIVMPGMAFDERLGRLGHGKGFYDRFLQRYKEIDKSVADASGEKPRMPLLGTHTD
ncbi:hypothetical protein LTR04_002025 [Oleoguttula sp. CCFEE 6159]|nr:hypothetical protein LTR04_002025 [Oleoguttula sp. CCFEE 6159]